VLVQADGTGRSKPIMEGGYSLPVFHTKDGCSVTNRLNTHVAGAALRWLKYAIPRIDTRGRSYVSEEIEFPKVIGMSIVVPTEPGDNIVYALRPRRLRLSRMVVGKEPIPTRHFTVNLLSRREEPGSYLIISAWLGARAAPEPAELTKMFLQGVGIYDPNFGYISRRQEQKESRKFWDSHAFVLERTLHWPDTVRKERPSSWASPPEHIDRFKRKRMDPESEMSKETQDVDAGSYWEV
jgi:hypothetical protein